MKKFVLLSTLLLCCFTTTLFAQKKTKNAAKKAGHELQFHVQDARDTMVYLVIHFRDKMILKDSLKVTTPGHFVFAGNQPYQEGLYMLISQGKRPYVNFLIDGNQYFSVHCDTTGKLDDIRFVNSPENDEMLGFQKKTHESQLKINDLREKKKKLKDSKKDEAAKEELDNQIKAVNDDVNDYIQALIARNPNALFSKLQKAYQPVHIPDSPVKEDGTIDSLFQGHYYLEHYFDNVDLTDSRLLYTPVMEPKFVEYFTKMLYYQETDTVIKYVDDVLAKTEADSVFYRFMVEWLTYRFETSKIIGHDAVFVHLAKNNQLAGKCTWLDEDLIKKYEKRVKNLEPVLIGSVAPEIIMPDTLQSEDYRYWKSSYNFEKPYVILWFYDPKCPTCKKEATKLHHVYDSLETAGTRNFDVYGIASASDLNSWKKYLREQKYPWVNVGGLKANIDYMTAYNIYETGNPSMFIMDNRTKEIILNRRIEMSNIPEFLRQYERIQRIKAERKAKQ